VLFVLPGIKHLHVLPFVSQFCLMAHDMEVGLAEGLAAVANAAADYSSRQALSKLDEQQQQQQEDPGQSAAVVAAATVRHGKQCKL
jgi:hypothetical protein